MESEPFDVYITKYALTQGIIKLKGTRVCDDVKGVVIKVKSDKIGGFDTYYHGGEWHATFTSAKIFADKMRLKKILSLNKQIKKLKSLKFYKGEQNAKEE